MSHFFTRHQSKLIAAMVFLGLAAMIWLDEQQHKIPKGHPAPSVTFKMLDGSPDVSLAALQGKPVVLDFWQSWCGPCRKTLPHVDELAKKLAGRAHVIAVNSGDESLDLQTSTRDSLRLTLPMAVNGMAAAAAYHVEMLPTTVVLDREGKVVESFVGATAASRIEDVVRQLESE